MLNITDNHIINTFDMWSNLIVSVRYGIHIGPMQRVLATTSISDKLLLSWPEWFSVHGMQKCAG